MKGIKLINQYRLLDKELALYSYKLKSERISENEMFIPDISNKNSLEKELAKLKNKVQNIEKPDEVFSLLNGHFMDFITGQELLLESLYSRPMKHISTFINTFNDLMRKDSRPDVQRAELLLLRYSKADEIWESIKIWISGVSELYLKEFIDMCNLFINLTKAEIEKIPVYLPNLNEKQLEEVTKAIRALSVKMEIWIQYIKTLMASKGMAGLQETLDTDSVQLSESYYRSVLSDELGVSLDELLSWYDTEMENTRNEVFEIANRIKTVDPVPKTLEGIKNLLIKYAGPCSTPEEMFRRGNEYIKRSKAACKGYVLLPDNEECDIIEIPMHFRFTHPWGGYNGGCVLRRPLRGQMFLNNYNFKAITDGWIKMNTVHEAYPGHHVQFVKAMMGTIPETAKIGAKLVPLLEGTAHRSERVFEFIFEEDQFYPLFIAYRRHHTAVRIKADLLMRYFGRSIGEVVKLYMDELGFDRGSARAQIRDQEVKQGYFTCYYYGMKKICDWEKMYGYDDKSYTELLFSVGRIGLNSFERFIRLNDTDKYRYLSDFPSLLQFN